MRGTMDLGVGRVGGSARCGWRAIGVRPRLIAADDGV